MEDTKAAFLAGHTLNQNPVSCAGAIAAIQYVEDHDLINKSRDKGAYLLARLQELVDEWAQVAV